MKNVSLTGNLGADAKIIEMGGHTGLSFDMAVTERYRDSQGVWRKLTDWVNVTKWDKREHLDKMLPYFKKGSKVLVSGKYKLSSHKDKPQMSVNVSEMELLSSLSKP